MTQENDTVRDTQGEEMARYGIIRIPVDNFYYREFHYTSLKDAVAQARRDEAQPGSSPPA